MCVYVFSISISMCKERKRERARRETERAREREREREKMKTIMCSPFEEKNSKNDQAGTAKDWQEPQKTAGVEFLPFLTTGNPT